mmetsp:Transcript_56539/g.151160  ORF Transcript_56539/g.151160 Transcript_56539/m.151160 type:complete len:102 (-) Transcript_56539:195-500(-)
MNCLKARLKVGTDKGGTSSSKLLQAREERAKLEDEAIANFIDIWKECGDVSRRRTRKTSLRQLTGSDDEGPALSLTSMHFSNSSSPETMKSNPGPTSRIAL